MKRKTKEIKIRRKVFFVSSIAHKNKSKYNRKEKYKKEIQTN